MSETVLISTHALELAGKLRDAFREAGHSVRLVTDLADVEREGGRGLLVLTGEEDHGSAGASLSRWMAVADVPVLLLKEGAPSVDGEGVLEVFPPQVEPDEVVLTGRKAMERRKLQEATGIVGNTDAMREAMERVVQIAPVESTVLITGESGTGKELVARGLHALSPRRHRSFIAVNVAALSETLLESELFGHEKGAFTGAIDTRKGLFELAHKGTIFLDEIGEMPLTTQTKLLRVLEQREFLRVGGESPIRVDLRVLTATNQDLKRLVALGDFRKDLYYRLNILNIRLPPLRERREDVPLLVEHFTREVAQRIERPFPGISREAMEILQDYDWPGNVRELRNLVESMVVLAPGKEIGAGDIPSEIRWPGGRDRLLPVPTGTRRLPEKREETESGGKDRRELRPELEFVFRTLMELRMDMDELRREFEEYREDVEERMGLGGASMQVGRFPSSREARGSSLLSEGEVSEASPGNGGPYPEVEGRSEEAVSGSGAEASPVEPAEPVHTKGDSAGEGREGPGPEPESSEDEGTVVFRPGMTMEDLEREAIITVLERTEGNRREAAEVLGIGERTLYRKIRKYSLDL